MTQTDTRPRKPLGGPAYGSIPHLPSSENGGDKTITQGQADIILDEPRDEKDNIIATLKYDGSCTAVAKVDGKIVPLMRAGYPAKESNFKQNHLFSKWVFDRYDVFDDILDDGERIVGEWLIQAHGTKYEIRSDALLWLAFDLYQNGEKQPIGKIIADKLFDTPIWFVRVKENPSSTAGLLATKDSGVIPESQHEGIVYRVEREGEVDFMAKWVRDKRDGKYLPGVDGSVTDEPIWNYPPDEI